MGRKSAKVLGLALGCVALFSAAMPVFTVEYAAVVFTRLAPDQQLFALAGGDIRLPSSLRAERMVLRACETSLASPLGQFQPEDVLAALRSACAKLAEAARERSPTSSWAHLVVAAAATSDADFERAFVLSQETGAFEGELAQRRLALGITRQNRGADAFRSALAADASVLAQFATGRDQLAQLYRAFPEARDFIVTSIEMAPEAAQSAFVETLRRAGG